MSASFPPSSTRPAILALVMSGGLLPGCFLDGQVYPSDMAPGADPVDAARATVDAAMPKADLASVTDSGPSARQLFDTTVMPVLRDTCQTCHSSDFAGTGPDYLGGPTTAFYGALTMNARLIGDSPANSLIVNKGAHAGPALTSAQKTDLEAFIVAWNHERGVTAPMPTAATPTLTQALDKFSRCMTESDWDASGLDTLGDQATTQGACTSCHATGTGGNWLGANQNGNSATFTHQKQMPYVLKWVLGTVDAQGAFAGLVPANRFRDKGQEPGTHPKFVLSTARIQGVEAFVVATLARYNAGTCP